MDNGIEWVKSKVKTTITSTIIEEIAEAAKSIGEKHQLTIGDFLASLGFIIGFEVASQGGSFEEMKDSCIANLQEGFRHGQGKVDGSKN